MKIAVCVKYVPVVSQIKFDYQQKTIIREGVPSEINPFDLLGLVRAVQLKSGPEDQVVAISMGPPSAREGLVQCLALGADRAVLISDRLLAGSDTLATSRALALALGQEQPNLIICGRNSADAETGQVGPEIAELMGIPHVSQVRKLDLDAGPDVPGPGTVMVERVTDEGHQLIKCPLPAVVCVTEGVAPEMYPGRDELAQAQELPVEEVTCAQLSSDLSHFRAGHSLDRVRTPGTDERGRYSRRCRAASRRVLAGAPGGSVRRRRWGNCGYSPKRRLPTLPGKPRQRHLGGGRAVPRRPAAGDS